MKTLFDATRSLVIQVDAAKWPSPYNAALADALGETREALKREERLANDLAGIARMHAEVIAQRDALYSALSAIASANYTAQSADLIDRARKAVRDAREAHLASSGFEPVSAEQRAANRAVHDLDHATRGE